MFYNPNSGRFSPSELNSLYTSFQHHFPNCQKIHNPEQLRVLKDSHVISIGGDGTFHVLINHLDLETNTVSVWKMGSGNDFVSNWEKQTVKQLSAAIEQGDTQAIDLIQVGDKIKVHTVWGVGFDAFITQKAHSWNLGIPVLKYILPIARYLFFFKPIRVRIESESYHYSGPAFMLSIGNGPRAGGGFQLFPTALMNDGLMNLLLIKPPGFFQKLAYVWLVSFGKHNRLRMVEIAALGQCKISLETAGIMGCDGEVYPCTTLEIKVLSGVLKLIQ